MSEFQKMNGVKLSTFITAVAGGSILLKLIPGRGEKVPIPIIITPVSVANVQDINNRTVPNFSTFKLVAVAVGTASLYAGSAENKPVAGPVTVNIVAKAMLPAANTDQGLLTRLLLAETPSPEMPNYSDEDAEAVMVLMRAVISNRLAKPSHLYASADAKNIADVIRA